METAKRLSLTRLFYKQLVLMKIALFQITIDPNGGLVIQSVKTDLKERAFREVLQENDLLMKRLAKR